MAITSVTLISHKGNIKILKECNDCHSQGQQSIGLMWWLLAREVLRLRGTISRDHPWDIMPDLFFYRDPEEVEKEEKEAQERAKEDVAPPQEQWTTDPGEDYFIE